MSTVEDKISKLREERLAREKARIQKLRELNLKKYSKDTTQNFKPPNHLGANKLVKSENGGSVKNISSVLSNHYQGNCTRRPSTAPVPIKKNTNESTENRLKKPQTVPKDPKVISKNEIKVTSNVKNYIKSNISNVDNRLSKIPKKNNDKPVQVTNYTVQASKSIVCKDDKKIVQNGPCKGTANSSMLPTVSQSASNVHPNRESVFDRLYKPKVVTKPQVSAIDRVKNYPNFLKKNSDLILNKRQTMCNPKPTKQPMPVRRSISAVHFKRIKKDELSNCIHKWASIGDKINKVHMKNIDEDEHVKQDKIISAVKSEHKKVKFLTPTVFNTNTPRPEELQNKLKNWLQKRGKSYDSYQHLQCFGLHHMSNKLKPFNLEKEVPKIELYDEENKENIALESDSDDASYTDNVNDRKNDFAEDKDKADIPMNWRRVSSISESLDINETPNTTLNSEEIGHQVDDLLLGALQDLTSLCREGFEWEQCARWLRAIRMRFPTAVDAGAYWECRAALEERRGDFPASVHCWEEAIAKGTERSVVESNVDQLLDKFMQLKISPNSAKKRRVDPKMVDVKNVVKSTLIRFAVQQAKLRQATQGTSPKYIVTPVRRSARISTNYSRTPLRECTSMRIADTLTPRPTFVPNPTLINTP